MKLISKGARKVNFGEPFEIPDAGQVFELEPNIAAQACVNANWADYPPPGWAKYARGGGIQTLEAYSDKELRRMVMKTGNDNYPTMVRSELLEVLNAE